MLDAFSSCFARRAFDFEIPAQVSPEDGYTSHKHVFGQSAWLT